MSVILRKLCRGAGYTVQLPPRCSARGISLSPVVTKTFEPDYLDSAVPPIPTYPPINIQARNYYGLNVLAVFSLYRLSMK